MAHELYIANGVASMAYVGKTPWHGLGQNLPEGQTIEQWLQAAGMTYTVEQGTVRFADCSGTMREFPERTVLFRSDTGAPLGVVSDHYKVVQPAQVLEFFRDLCADSSMTLETAGVLKGGALYWGLARTHIETEIFRNDVHKGFLLLTTSADGTSATRALFTAIRAVCRNTIRLALASADGVSTKHNVIWSADATKKSLGLVDFDGSWNDYVKTMQDLQQIQVSPEVASSYFAELLRPKSDRAAPRAQIGATSLDELLNRPAGFSIETARTDKSDVVIDRAIRGHAELLDCYYQAPGACPGTAYGLVQGVTRFIDHSRGKSADKRLTSAWFGQGDRLKQQAVEKAMALAA